MQLLLRSLDRDSGASYGLLSTVSFVVCAALVGYV